MDRTELYLKTAFCCMACDGDIAQEEIDLIKGVPLFQGIRVHDMLQEYLKQLRDEGSSFLGKYLKEVENSALTETEECELARVAIQIIEADESVEYSEVAFFKKIRKKLHASDEKLLAIIPEDTILPDREDYLMPDISDEDDLSLWSDTFVVGSL